MTSIGVSTWEPADLQRVPGRRGALAGTVAPVRTTLAWGLSLSIAACGGSRRAGSDAGSRDAVADVAPTLVGAACRGDDECGGLRCAARFERMCAGPVRAHTWSIDFPGGWCNPAIDLARGDIPGGCPAGSSTVSAFVGCDGVPFRFCTRRCETDADCRAAEGYRCNRESMLCMPPALVPEEPDAGADGG